MSKHKGIPTEKTILRLARAAAAMARGANQTDAADSLGIPRNLLAALVSQHPEQWAVATEEAKATLSAEFRQQQQRLIEAVREAAKSTSLPVDVDRYIEAAKLADEFARDDGGELFPHGEAMTLTRFYREWYVPQRLTDAAAVTRKTYEGSLSRWRLLTGDPPLREITTATLTKFRDALAKMGAKRGVTRVSPTTVCRHLRHIHGLLSKAGPPGPRNRDAAGFIPAPVPWVRPPRARIREPRIVTDQEIEACYKVACLMEDPAGLPFKPGAWWRAMIVLLWNTGLRINTVFAMQWADIDFGRGLAVLPPERMKSRRFQVSPLNETVLDHLRAIRTGVGPVFPWPYRREAFFRAFHKMQDLAGIPTERHFGTHDIRKTLATRLWAVGPEAAVLALGHAGADVTLKHYVQGPQIVARALDRLEQPQAFQDGRKRTA